MIILGLHLILSIGGDVSAFDKNLIFVTAKLITRDKTTIILSIKSYFLLVNLPISFICK
jgi:hypothetical protein